jgi:hypothetical protein
VDNKHTEENKQILVPSNLVKKNENPIEFMRLLSECNSRKLLRKDNSNNSGDLVKYNFVNSNENSIKPKQFFELNQENYDYSMINHFNDSRTGLFLRIVVERGYFSLIK